MHIGCRNVVLAWIALGALSACDGAPAAGADGGVPDAGAPEGGIVVAAPAPPSLTPCPAGWHEVTGPSGIASCDPWPSTGYDEHCAFDSAHFPGTPGCARIGTACAADGWPSDLPTDRAIVYVDDGAPAGGDGSSRDHAFVSIAAAITAAPTGAVIAVATGHYDVFAELRTGQTLWGACVDGTRLSSSGGTPDHGVVDLAGVGSGVRNLGIDPSPRLGVYSVAAMTTVQDVAMSGTTLAGIWVDEGPTSVRNVVMRDVQFYAGSHYGSTIEIEYGAMMTLDHVIVERPAYAGLYVDMDSSVAANDFVIRESQYGAIYAQEGGSVSLVRTVVADVVHYGVVLTASARFDATDLVVDGVTATAAGDGGDAVYADHGVHATLTRAHVLRYAHNGVAVGLTGTDVTVTDSLVEQGGPGASDNGTALFAAMGGALHVLRVLVDHAATAGIYVADTGTTFDASDVTVRATRGQPATGLGGNGLLLFDGAAATLTRVLIDQVQMVGFAAAGAGSSATATDLRIQGTRAQSSDGHFGRGVELQDGASLELRRAIVEQSQNAGFFLAASHLSATDLIVRDTRSDPGDGTVGVGLWAQEDATVVLENTRVERSHFIGVAAVGATVMASHLVVEGVDAADCGSSSCPGIGGGFGIASHFGGIASITGFEVRGAALCGVVVGENDPARAPTAMDLDTGVVSLSPVGACVQTAAFDSERLHHGVVFSEVGVPLQATMYSLPMSLR